MATRHAPWRGLSSGGGLLPVHRCELPAGCVLPESAGEAKCQRVVVDTPAGEWQQDHQHGQGKARWIDGSAYDGMWARGVRWAPQPWCHRQLFEPLLLWSTQTQNSWGVCRAGHGVLVRVDGYKYDGSWQDDAENGTGEGWSGTAVMFICPPCTVVGHSANMLCAHLQAMLGSRMATASPGNSRRASSMGRVACSLPTAIAMRANGPLASGTVRAAAFLPTETNTKVCGFLWTARSGQNSFGRSMSEAHVAVTVQDSINRAAMWVAMLRRPVCRRVGGRQEAWGGHLPLCRWHPL